MLKAAAEQVLRTVREKKAGASVLEEYRRAATPAIFRDAAPAAPAAVAATAPATAGGVSSLTATAESRRRILNTLLTTLGAGAGARGLLGLSQITAPTVKLPSVVPTGTVEMPVLVKKKKPVPGEKAANGPTDPSGVSWYAPGMLLAGSLGTYGGWKGVDMLLDQHRQKQTQDELDEAKNEYAAALRGAYNIKAAAEKTAADQLSAELDLLFDSLEKTAFVPGAIDTAKGAVSGALSTVKDKLHAATAPAPASGIGGKLNEWFDTTFPNLKGQATNAAALYALPSAAMGYMAVDGLMAQNSRRRLLQRALDERERQKSERRPAELYAVPMTEDELDEG